MYIAWPQYRFFLLDALHNIVVHLKRHTILARQHILPSRQPKQWTMWWVCEVKVDWLDRIIQRTHGDRECLLLLSKVKTFRAQVKEAETYHINQEIFWCKRRRFWERRTQAPSTTNHKIKIFWSLAPQSHYLLRLACFFFVSFFFVNFLISSCNGKGTEPQNNCSISWN